jgi:hypothetical protein
MNELLQPGQIAGIGRKIEPERKTNGLLGFGRPVLAQNRRRDVARQHFRADKNKKRNREER